jgi:SAM-dependent methyltransferase
MFSAELRFPNSDTPCVMSYHAQGNLMSVIDPFVYSGTELDAMAQARNYCRWILGFFAPHLGNRVAEIGAGAGTFSQFLLSVDGSSELVLFEPGVNLFPLLQQQFEHNSRVRLHFGSFDPSSLHEPLDSVVMVNVLEHIRDDEALLPQIWQSLRPGGCLLLFVPALQWNYGSLDKAFEHHRRYSKIALKRKLEKAGFRVERARYVNFLGVASWFFAGRVLRQKTLNPRQVRWYDRWVIPWSFKLEQIWEPPVGQSLIAIAVK